MNKQQSGRYGEAIARSYLEEKGYKILAQNWRHGRLEVDLIATYKIFFVIIEVKARKNADFGTPDESVGNRKINFLAEAAAAYQDKNNIDLETRFDIVSVLYDYNPPQITHIEDAFHP